MRTPLARHDGWLSAARAHSGQTLERAAKLSGSSLMLFRYNPPITWFPLLRTMTGLIGIHPQAAESFQERLNEPLMVIQAC